MSYTDKFGGTGEAYEKLPLLETHKKIADGEITPEEASALSVMGAMKSLNASLIETPAYKKINIYEKYLIIKDNSSKGLEKSDFATLLAFAEAIAVASANGELVKKGEIGEFYSEVKAITGEISKKTEDLKTDEEYFEFLKNLKSNFEKKVENLQKKAQLIKGHSDAVAALRTKVDAIAEAAGGTEVADAVKTAIRLYCEKLDLCSELCKKTWDYVQNIKDMPEYKNIKNPDKEMLDKKNPEEIKKEIEKNTYSSDKRKSLVKCLEENFSDTDVDGFEKLIWLDDSGETVGKLIARMKNFYSKSKSEGWIGSCVRNLASDFESAPKIPSKNKFWDIVIILVSVALAAFVALQPAVTSFLAGASTPVLAIITIVAFFVGAGFGGFFIGIVVAFAWILLSYFIDKLIPFEVLLHIIVVLILLVPAVFAGGDILTRSKGAIKNAKYEKRRYYEKLLEKCENLQSYLASLTEKINVVGEKEGAKTAAKYYDGLKERVSRTVDRIHTNLKELI